MDYSGCSECREPPEAPGSGLTEAREPIRKTEGVCGCCGAAGVFVENDPETDEGFTIRNALVAAQRQDMTKPPVTARELQAALEALERLTGRPLSFFASVTGMQQLADAQAEAERLREAGNALADAGEEWVAETRDDDLPLEELPLRSNVKTAARTWRSLVAGTGSEASGSPEREAKR